MSKIIRSAELEGQKDLAELLGTTESAYIDLREVKVMTSDELELRQEASRIILEAQSESQRIRDKAKLLLEQVENERAAARTQGFEEGYQEGMGQATELIATTQDLRARMLADAEPQLLQLAFEAVKKVIGHAAREGVVKDVVREALDSVVGQAIIIRIHPEDRSFVEASQCLTEARQRLGALIQIKEDATIGQGGCIIDSEVGTVDARLEVQLAALEKAFSPLGGAKHG